MPILLTHRFSFGFSFSLLLYVGSHVYAYSLPIVNVRRTEKDRRRNKNTQKVLQRNGNTE